MSGWEIARPAVTGEPWMATPRRAGLPFVTGTGLAELGVNLRAAAELPQMLALEQEFPGWLVRRSSLGAWWATRTAVLSGTMQFCGLRAIVGGVAASKELRALLAGQARLAEWASAREWQIPGEAVLRELGLLPGIADLARSSRC